MGLLREVNSVKQQARGLQIQVNNLLMVEMTNIYFEEDAIEWFLIVTKFMVAMKPISTNSNVSFNGIYILKKMQLSES